MLRRRVRSTGVTLSPGARRQVKRAWELGARRTEALLGPLALVRDANGVLYGLTSAEDRALRAAASASGAQLEADARVTDALGVACATMTVAATLLGLLIFAVQHLP